MEVDRISVIADLNISPFTRGVQNLIKQARSAEAELGKVGTSSEKSAVKGESAFDKLSAAIRGTQDEAGKGADFETRADTKELDNVGNLFSKIRSDAAKGVTLPVSVGSPNLKGLSDLGGDRSLKLDVDTSGVVAAEAALGHLDESADNLDGRTINLDVDRNKLDGAASGIDGLAGKVRDLGAVLAIGSIPAFMAGIGAIPAVASAAAAGVGALAIGLGAGLAGAAAVGGGAVAALGAGTYAAGGLMAQAAANALLLGDGFGTLAGEAKAAEDQVKAANELIAIMPAGTDAAAAAQERLAIATQYQADATQLQIDWWNKYGDSANALQSSVNALRLGFVGLTSDVGGQLIPVLQQFVGLAVNNLSMLEGPLDAIVAGTEEGVAGFYNFISSAQGLTAVQNILDLVGASAGPAINIITNGFQIALLAVQPLIPAIEAVETALSTASTAAADWTASAEGSSIIAEVWAVLLGYGSQLTGILADLGEGFFNIGEALYASGLVDLTMGGLQTAVEGFEAATMSTGGLADNLSLIGPVLTSIGGLASVLADQFLYMADAVLHAVNPETGNNTLVELIDSLSAAIPPIAEILVSTFEQLAPAISRNIGPISEFIGTFIGSSGTLVHVIDFLGGLAETFNNMPEGIKSAAVEIAAFGAVVSLLGGGGLAQTAFYTSGAALNIGRMGVAAATATPGILAFAAANSALLIPLLGLAAIGAIAILVAVYFDEEAYAATYEEARTRGESVGGSFGEGVIAGLGAVPIVGPFVEWLDANIAVPLDEFLKSVSPEVSLWDVIMGTSSAEEHPILGPLQTAYEEATTFLAGLAPEVSLFDVIMGNATMGEAAAGGSPVANLLLDLQEAWNGAMEWLGGLVPDVNIMDKLMGLGEAAGDIATLMTTPLQAAWDSAMEWISGLVPEISLMDIITGVTGASEEQVQPILDSLNSIWTHVVEIWEGIKKDTGEALTSLYNDYFLYYLGPSGVVITSISEFFTSLYNDYFLYYFGAAGALVTPVLDFFTLIYNDYFLYYLGADGVVMTTISEFFSVLYNDWFLYYFGSDGALVTPITEFFSYIYNDWFLYYLGPEGVIVTAAGDAWQAILDAVTPFTDSFTSLLSTGIQGGVDAALGWFKTLLDGAASVMSAIGADDTAAALTSAAQALPITTEAAYHGLVTDSLARGGSRGGMGTYGANSRLIEWNEQANGREWWIATGDSDKQRQISLLAGAARDLDMAVAPMASGGGLPGVPIWRMSIGGGTDLGPAGLTGEAAQIAQEVMDMFGVWTNTYTGDPSVGGEHGSLHGNTHENTFDFWNDSGFGALGYDTGYAIEDYVFGKYGSDLDTVIWQGVGTGPSGAFYDDDHYDHLHMSVGGSGLSNTAGVIANALFSIAKKVWDGVISSLGTASFGDGPIWDGVEEFAGTIPGMAWEFLLRQIPRGWGGAVGGAIGGLTGGIQDMLSQGINAAGWGADELAALTELWGNESGLDPNAVNPESGAYGIPQINPASWGNPVPLGDAASQIAWGIDYIQDAYGTASDALDFWLANGWYAQGGVIPGAGPQVIGAHGGERVLPRSLNSSFEALASSVSVWSARGGGDVASDNIAGGSAARKLDAILGAIEYGNNNPTPVNVNNTPDFHKGFVAGALAAQASDAGAEITDQQLSEGIGYYREFYGRTT